MNKKEAILKSVLKLVNREGFYHLNMKKIASEAGIAAGTVYLYFRGKEDLINALYKMIVTSFNKSILEVYHKNQSVKSNYYVMMERAMKFYLDDPDYFSFIEQYTYAPFLFKDNQEENFLLLMPIYKMIRLGKKQRLIKNLPDAYLLSLIHGPLNTVIKLHLAHKTDLHKKGAQQKFFDSVWNAIATRVAASPGKDYMKQQHLIANKVG